MTTNPYIRASEKFEELKEKALRALEKRQQEETEIVVERARDDQGRFIADDPSTAEVNEAWQISSL